MMGFSIELVYPNHRASELIQSETVANIVIETVLRGRERKNLGGWGGEFEYMEGSKCF